MLVAQRSSGTRRKSKGWQIPNYVVGSLTAFAVLAVAVVAVPGAQHWFILPVIGCGWLMAIDVARWVRGQLDVFDPYAIVALIGFYFFCIAPILHVEYQYYVNGVQRPSEWRDWIGLMATLNLTGIIVYRYISNKSLSLKSRKRDRIWLIDRSRVKSLLPLFLLGTALLQAYVYYSYGGIRGYIGVYEGRYEETAFEGMGFLFTVSESFPILAMLGFAVLAERRPNLRRWGVLVLVLGVFVVLKLLFGGLRGSRSNTVWGIFWAVGIIHYGIRPVSKMVLFSMLPLLFAFMYLYGFYKSIGYEAFELMVQEGGVTYLDERTGRDKEVVLLGDLSRADVQAYILFRTVDPHSDYQYALGRTYVGSAAKLIPARIWPSRPIHKIKEGTEVIYGSGTFEHGIVSSRVYGLSGEAMLNFGPLGVPFAFIVFALVVAVARSPFRRWVVRDARWLLIPFVANLCFVILVSDSDNLIFFTVKNGLLPFLFIYACSSKKRILS